MPDKGFITVNVTDELAENRLDIILASVMSRRLAKKLIASGAVFVNNKRVKVASRKIKKGSVIKAPEFLPVQNETEWEKHIIFENKEIIVINKPEKTASAPTLWGETGSVSFELSKLLKTEIFVIQRLDYATSGVMILAKNKSAASKYEKILASSESHKIYLAVTPNCSLNKKIINHKLAPAARRGRFTVSENGKSALTEILNSFDYENLTVFKIKLLTGRTHQVRVHLSYENCGIIGDTWYGSNGKVSGISSVLSGDHLYLHAFKLILPVDGKIKTFSAELPEYWKIPLPSDF